jgi:hypothetical protein
MFVSQSSDSRHSSSVADSSSLSAQNAVSAASASISSIGKAISGLTHDLATIQAAIAILEAELSGLKAPRPEDFRKTETQTQGSPPRSVQVQVPDTAAFNRAMSAYNQKLQDLQNRISAKRNELAQKQTELAAKQQELAKAKQDFATAQRELEQALNRDRQALQQAREQQAREQQRIAQLEKQAIEARAQARKAEQDLQRSQEALAKMQEAASKLATEPSQDAIDSYVQETHQAKTAATTALTSVTNHLPRLEGDKVLPPLRGLDTNDYFELALHSSSSPDTAAQTSGLLADPSQQDSAVVDHQAMAQMVESWEKAGFSQIDINAALTRVIAQQTASHGAATDDELSAGSVVAGAAAGVASIPAAVHAKCSLEARKLFQQVNGQLHEVRQNELALHAQRTQLVADLDTINAKIDAHIEAKPKGGGPSAEWVRTMQSLQTDKQVIVDNIKTTNLDIQATATRSIDINGVGTVRASDVGQVGAVIVDNLTGESFAGINNADKSVPTNLHPLLAERYFGMDHTRMHGSEPASHAEVWALNDALHAREGNTGRPVTEADLSSFTLDTVWLKGGDEAGRVNAGDQAPRCANCAQLTTGVDNLAGNSTKAYSTSPIFDGLQLSGVETATPPRSQWSERYANGARQGALFGGGAGFLFSSIDAVADGQVTGSDAANIAGTTTLGALSGAVDGVIEEATERAINNVAGDAIERGAVSLAGRFVSAEAAGGAGAMARNMAGKLGGAGAAGAVVNGVFATVDQIGAYQRGEVTGSQAVGTVVGEMAVGAGAGIAGAAAGAAIGSVIPIAGTAAGAVVGFAVGMAAGYLADKGLRALGADKVVANFTTAVIDKGADIVEDAGKMAGEIVDKGADIVEDVGGKVLGGVSSLAHAFGW